jgi:2-aminoadipate transaminase
MNLTLNHPQLISLAAGFTDHETLPVMELRAAVNQVLNTRESALPALQYGSTEGSGELRRITAARLAAQDTAAGGTVSAYPADHLVITNGSQQLLYLAAEALCDPGDVVLVEDPTYFVFLGIAQSHGLKCRGVRMTEHGIDPEHLDRVLYSLRKTGGLRRTKFLYLVSYFQNPSGLTASFENKRQALAILRAYEQKAGHPIYLLEDAAYRELRFTGDDVPSALAVAGAAERVIYAGTYSKPFATGLRVGFGWLPDSVRSVILRIKSNHDFGTSNLSQCILAAALKNGSYDRHLPALQNRYARKAKTMLKSLHAAFPRAAQWVAPQGGLYCWTQLPRAIKTGPRSAFFRDALKANVLYVPGELCYADDTTRPKPQNGMRLSFGNASPGDIQTAIGRLGALAQRRAIN